MSKIPVIDFDGVGINHPNSDVNFDTLKSVSEGIKQAFTDVGFCYLRNHGINQELIDSFFRLSREFFESSPEVKRKYKIQEGSFFGWMSMEHEHLNPDRPGDLKETYNYLPYADTGSWTSVKLQEVHQNLFRQFSELTERILDGLSMNLGLNQTYFKDMHKFMGKSNNQSALRSLYYPALEEGTTLKPGQVRLGEHTDYGTITILIQDDVGGLEVDIPGTGFVPATPIPGTVIINIGSMMQRWTSDHLIATTHRVLIPEEEFRKRLPRQSAAFFVQPDDGTVITCLDGSDKYSPISSREYLDLRIKAAIY